MRACRVHAFVCLCPAANQQRSCRPQNLRELFDGARAANFNKFQKRSCQNKSQQDPMDARGEKV